MSTYPHIAIIGAGPAGLTLSRILHQHSIPCSVFDADPSRHGRDQGGTLDLSVEDGQKALHAADLFPEFCALARPEGQARKQVSYDGTVLWDDSGSAVAELFEKVFESPEIDRAELRGMLIESLPAESISWGRRVVSISQDKCSRERHVLHFADGSEEGPFDLVVGADGAWSKVRPSLTATKPYYSGVTMAELWALDADVTAPRVAEYVGRGSCFMFDEGRAIMAQRAGRGNIKVYAVVRQPESWAADSEIDWRDEERAKEQLLDGYFADCGEDLKEIVMGCKDKLVVRKLYMLPVGVHWENQPGMTVIGDAAHLMTPFAGVGVNCAMRDALELANRIVARTEKGGLKGAVEDFEVEMFLRAKVYQEMTAEGLRGHFSKDGNAERVKKMKRKREKIEAWASSYRAEQ